MRTIITLGLAAALAGAHAAAPLTPAQIAAIDSAATKTLAGTGVPAASIAIVQDGAIVYAHAYGTQRPGQPARTDARYPVGSVSKQFTAAAALLLAEDGMLSLDDRVGRYLPGLTGAGTITVRQLLSHTAGYRDYWPQDYSFAAMAHPTTPGGILDRWARAPLDFAPGTRWQYSNTGYVAAGQIVERASGQLLLAFLRARIFAPLGMAPVDQDSGLTAADPLGYHRFALGPVRVAAQPAPGWLYAAGELAMTATDLARWDMAMIAGEVLKPASWHAQQTEVLLADGSGTGYGLGVDVAVAKGHRRISHGGEAVGYMSENRVYPEDRAAIVVLDNADFSNAVTAIADAIETTLFADAGGTDRARALFAQLRRGEIDRAAFTVNGNGYFTPAVLADFRSSLGPLGEPRSFVRTRSALRGGLTAERYLLDFGSRKLEITLRAEPGPEGRVEQFTIYPAD